MKPTREQLYKALEALVRDPVVHGLSAHIRHVAKRDKRSDPFEAAVRLIIKEEVTNRA